jgi:hypothetical protein
MRYGKGHKQATRQRILEAAGRRFRPEGCAHGPRGDGLTLLDDRA